MPSLKKHYSNKCKRKNNKKLNLYNKKKDCKMNVKNILMQ